MKNILLLSTLIACSLLTACGGERKNNTTTTSSSSSMSSLSSARSSSSMSSSSMPMLKLSVTVTNLTAGQPLSPTAIVLHKPNFKAFEVGMPASVELERIAEGGNPTDFLADANANNATFVSARASAGIAPGMNTTIMLESALTTMDQTNLRLTAISMLGNTNDG